ncbi:MAG: PhoH family protein [bacterium]|nr:PhoH family protein [Candidatus Minthenecus merdequi]
MIERIFEIDEDVDLRVLYGINNVNIRTIKDLVPQVKLVARGRTIKLSGEENDVEIIEENLTTIVSLAMRTNTLNEQQVIDVLKGNEVTMENVDNEILHGVGGKVITAKTKNQMVLMQEYEKNDLLFAVGPAGSGKTYTAIALAVRALRNKEVKKIILSRPAVEAGEKLGFLPGDMKDKIDPYLQPLYDALEDMIPQAKLTEYMEKKTIQIAPLAFMRGRTLSNAVVILDEAQNTSVPQIKMFLTRLGYGSKMIVTGDLTQVDLPRDQKSGLRDAVEVLKNVKGVSIVEFNFRDIVRHQLVTRIIEAYNKKID